MKPKLNMTVTSEQLARLDSPPAWLARQLTYRRRVFEPGGPTGLREKSIDHHLCDFDLRGRLVFPAGLVHRVVEALRADGQTVEIDDRREINPLDHDFEIVSTASRQELAILDAILDHPLGQLQVSGIKHLFERSLFIAKAFADAKIVFAVPTRRQARRLCWRLEQELQERVGLVAGTANKKGERCIVGTFESLNHLGGEWDLLILPYADESLGNTAARITAGLHHRIPRCYGLVVAAHRRDHQQQLRLEEMAGHVIAPLRKPRSPVYVTLADVPACTVAEAETALEQKRALYWHNTERNQRIAEVCRATAAGDAQALAGMGTDQLNFTAICDGREPRVAVLAESVEHARRLAQLLPGWQVYKGLNHPKRQRKMADKSGSKKKPVTIPIRRIITAVYSAQHVIRADVIVRATGGEGLLRAKGFPPATDYGLEPRPVLVIDFADAYHRAAQKNTKRRIREYQRAGMHLLPTARATSEIHSKNTRAS